MPRTSWAAAGSTAPRPLPQPSTPAILVLGDDLHQVWKAPTTTDKERKQLLRAWSDEVKIAICRDRTGGGG